MGKIKHAVMKQRKEGKAMARKKRIALLASLALSGVMAAGWMSQSALAVSPVVSLSAVEEEAMTGLDFAAQMKLGWNLGNTFDAPEGETAWGNPITSKELIDLVAELGFQTIRIPISWGKHVSAAPEYTIDEKFMTRVDTVVNQALDAGLYVVINSHHDNDIYSPTPDNAERGKEYLKAIWTQVGGHFADADDHLVFETMNEPRVVGSAYEWNVNANNSNCAAAMQVVNELNQTALDAIRATGGNNADRFVIVSAYAGSPAAATSSIFALPQDSAEDRLIVSLHAYTPYRFALDQKSGDSTFDRQDEGEIRTLMKSVAYRFNRKGVPVIFDEMGCLDKANPDDRYAWCKTFVSAAQEYGIPCLWWDNGAINTSGENFALINRRKLTVYDQSATVLQGLMDGLDAAAGE